jgi:hypothetical protein
LPKFEIETEEVLGLSELQALLQTISDNKTALRDVKVLPSPREGRFTVIWEQKV